MSRGKNLMFAPSAAAVLPRRGTLRLKYNSSFDRKRRGDDAFCDPAFFQKGVMANGRADLN